MSDLQVIVLLISATGMINIFITTVWGTIILNAVYRSSNVRNSRR